MTEKSRPGSTMNIIMSADKLSLGMNELVPKSLTDQLILIAEKTLNKNRAMIDSQPDIRSINLVIKLSAQQKPYKVFLTPTHESEAL